MQHIIFGTDGEGIATITLDHASEPVNLVSPAWLDEMEEAVRRIGADDAIRGVIIASAKRIFMAGADLKIMGAAFGTMTAQQAFALSQRGNALHRALETCGKPVVAAINGAALGGGYELALACHYRILADRPDAKTGLPEVTVGLLAGSGGTQRLPRLIGVEAALPLLIEGTVLGPAEALAKGLVDAVVPAGDVMAAARRWLSGAPEAVQPWDRKGFALAESDGLLKPATANLFANWTARIAVSKGRNYPAPVAILTAVSEGVQVSLDKGLLIEARHFAALLTDPVARNIIRTRFLARTDARKLVHRPAGIAKSTVARLGVLGAGQMGAGIAWSAALTGIEVVLLDASLDRAARGLAQLRKVADREVERGRMSEAAADALLARIRPTGDYADLAGSALVVEAVFEDRAIKADVTRKAEAVLGPDTVFATNTSTLPITGLAEASVRPESFIGLHFFSPVERMELVEVICGRKTSEACLARALDFVRQLGKTPIVVNDARGFFTSRVFQTFIHEGAAMLGEGIAPALIENAARAAGLPVGPLTVLDETTLSLPLKIVGESIAAEGAAYTIPCGTAVMRRLCALGRSGRSAGGGFYAYPQGAPKHLWPGLSDLFPRAARQPDVEEVSQRLLGIQAIETARCLQEDVLMRAADGDLGSLLGWGFPAWTGGTLSYVDTVGLDTFLDRAASFADRFGPRFTVDPGLAALLRSVAAAPATPAGCEVARA